MEDGSISLVTHETAGLSRRPILLSGLHLEENKAMRKFLALAAIAALGISAIGCGEAPAPAPVTPAPTVTPDAGTPTPDPAPATTDPAPATGEPAPGTTDPAPTTPPNP